MVRWVRWTADGSLTSNAHLSNHTEIPDCARSITHGYLHRNPEVVTCRRCRASAGDDEDDAGRTLRHDFTHAVVLTLSVGVSDDLKQLVPGVRGAVLACETVFEVPRDRLSSQGVVDCLACLGRTHKAPL